MSIEILDKIRSIGLKWKLLIPFLFFSFMGTTGLVYVGLSSQENLIKKEERKEIVNLYRLFQEAIEHKKEQAVSLAVSLAQDPEVRRRLWSRDREGLRTYMTPVYEKLREEFDIYQFEFHVPPARSFLRLHLPNTHGELVPYRKSILDALKSRKSTAALEWGLSGLGIRGICPVFHKGVLVGSMEVGSPFGRPFLEQLKRSWQADFTVFEKKGGGLYLTLATTLETVETFPPPSLKSRSFDEVPLISISPRDHPHHSLLLGPLKDAYGDVVAVVKIVVDRSLIKKRLSHTRMLMVLVGLTGVAISFFLVWLISWLFVRPIREIVREAQEIAAGKRESRLAPRPLDEVGDLTQSLNTMLEALKERRRQLEDYARTLEIRVRERTADLISSEEKYRTLVENLPLIVYRILEDGTTEFINPHFTETLGYMPEEVVGDKDFWREIICGHEDDQDTLLLDACFEDGQGFRIERVIRSKQGNLLTFIDRAMPAKDHEGAVRWIDGIMMDITELKRLQERALRTEEVRVLGEISARFAHEIRNPLATAGGFARRLLESFPEEDQPHRKMARIIVQEVARLEEILQIILSSIEPFTLCISDVDLNQIMRSQLQDIGAQIRAKGILQSEDLLPHMPRVKGDEGLLNRAFENFFKHAILIMPAGGTLSIQSRIEHDRVVVTFTHPVEGFSMEDLKQFFFPRFTYKDGMTIKDLPLSKVIIHRHGGKVDATMEGKGRLILRVEIPLNAME